jgi:hypothetical protein
MMMVNKDKGDVPSERRIQNNDNKVHGNANNTIAEGKEVGDDVSVGQRGRKNNTRRCKRGEVAYDDHEILRKASASIVASLLLVEGQQTGVKRWETRGFDRLYFATVPEKDSFLIGFGFVDRSKVAIIYKVKVEVNISVLSTINSSASVHATYSVFQLRIMYLESSRFLV